MSEMSHDIRRQRSGTGRGRPHPKGRQVGEQALAEIRALLGSSPRRRDLLIEHLHRIQDRFGHLSDQHLAALAEEMRLAQTEVFEVATFYAHFDVVKAGDPVPPPLTIRVCDSLTCELLGGRQLMETLQRRYAGDAVRIVRAPCMGRCAAAPVCEVGHRHVDHATVHRVVPLVAGHVTHPEIPPYQGFEAYVAAGGYRHLREARTMDPVRVSAGSALTELIDQIDDSGLRGLGGAGFPSARKWQFVRKEPKPRYLAINADEGEPGTFKDRDVLERCPHRFLEGVLLAAWSIEAEATYIYLRDEYPAAREILLQEIGRLEAEGLIRPGDLILRRGAGAYICGEESAMLESLEGRRGLPRHRPPYAAQVGLFGRPTLIHNVETVAWLPLILDQGAAWFAAQGRHGSKGLRSYSVSGRVREPGVKVAPAGITANELIGEFVGGMARGHTFKAYLPGGASGGILPASMADIPLDFGRLEEHGCFVGSHAVVVLSQEDDLRAVAINLLRFFADESCGQCTPCRLGCEKAVALMESDRWDEALLLELARAMADASICGLGQAAPNPIRSLFRFFGDELA